MASSSRKSDHLAASPSYTIAYLRVSTDGQIESGAGLAAQRAAVETYAARHGLVINRWMTEGAVSGSVAPTSRPELSVALSVLAKCKSGTLLVAKSDRIARKTADLLALRDLAERQHWTLRAADGSIDWTSAHGRAMSTVLGAFSEMERELIATRTREAMAAKKQTGTRFGKPVVMSEVVRNRITTERQNGRTFAAIAAGLNADGIHTARGGARWYPSTIRGVIESLALDRYSTEHSASGIEPSEDGSDHLSGQVLVT